ncbi:hypothetical protein ACQ661_12570 [Pseudidiomarina sp. WS423]
MMILKLKSKPLNKLLNFVPATKSVASTGLPTLRCGSQLARRYAFEGYLMKFLLLIALLLSSVVARAENLCPVNEDVAPDMRIAESDLTKERAEKAVEKVQGIVSGADSKYEWITVPNSLKIIEGYILKRDALNAEGVMAQYHKSQFCEFMKTQAWWYD